MNFDRKPPTDREYSEMVYSLLTEMNGAIMAQVRTINNTLAKVLLVMVDIQKSMDILNTGLKETRDKRYQEEIDELETQVEGLRKQINEKRVMQKTDSNSTSQEIRSIAMEAVTRQLSEEEKAQQLEQKSKWEKRKETAVNAAIGSGAVLLVGTALILIIPAIITFFETLLARLK